MWKYDGTFDWLGKTYQLWHKIVKKDPFIRYQLMSNKGYLNYPNGSACYIGLSGLSNKTGISYELLTSIAEETTKRF